MIGHEHGGHAGHTHGSLPHGGQGGVGQGGVGQGGGGQDGGPAAAPRSGAHRFRGRLAITFGLTAAFFLLELVVGLLSGSLALVADAGHMATDVLALGASLVATLVAGRPDESGRRTYGSYRAEVFAAGLAVLLMVGVGVFIVAEAISRMGSEPAVSATPMLVVGLIGLAVNGVGLIMLRTGSRQSINIRGAYLEVLGDAAGSVGVIIAGLLIRWTGSSVWDVVVAVVIGVFVLIRAVGLGRSVIRVLGQHAPEGVDPAAVEADLAAVPGVIEVHDLHLWSLTSGMNVATAHLVSAPEADNHAVLDAATKVLASAHHIEHATLQVEPADHSSCGETAW
ncbi:MAG TPA: cation diffusion facilitator family transporter [Nakamurella sp.]